jgi:hypothetical protein
LVQTEEERKAKKKEYQSRPEVQKRQAIAKEKYRLKPENIAKAKARTSTPEFKKESKKYRNLPENKLRIRNYENRPERKEKISIRDIALKNEVCLAYSKLHSNSDVPCCRCCNLNSHLDFLAIDHIQGRKELPENEKELVGSSLCRFLKRNKYPEGYQVLCHNCNTAKAYPKNNNKCPLEGKPH